MTDNKRLLELALKGLEAERQRIDQEMSDIHRQLGSRAGSSTRASHSAGNLTPAGRKKLSELMKKRWAEKRKAAAKAGTRA